MVVVYVPTVAEMHPMSQCASTAKGARGAKPTAAGCAECGGAAAPDPTGGPGSDHLLPRNVACKGSDHLLPAPTGDRTCGSAVVLARQKRRGTKYITVRSQVAGVRRNPPQERRIESIPTDPIQGQ